MYELEILEKIAATTTDPKVKDRTEKLIKAVKAQKARYDGNRSRSGMADKVIISVQRGS